MVVHSVDKMVDVMVDLLVYSMGNEQAAQTVVKTESNQVAETELSSVDLSEWTQVVHLEYYLVE